MARRRHRVWQRRPSAFWVEAPSRLALVEAMRPTWAWFTTVLTFGSLAVLAALDLVGEQRRPVALSVVSLVVWAGMTAALVVQWLTPMVEVTDHVVRFRGGPAHCFRFAIPGEVVEQFALERLEVDRWMFGVQVDLERRPTLPVHARLWLKSRLDGRWLIVTLADAVVDERRLRQAMQRLTRQDEHT
jgi:hypothetical protein